MTNNTDRLDISRMMSIAQQPRPAPESVPAVSTLDSDLTIAALDRALQRLRSTTQELDAVLRVLRGK